MESFDNGSYDYSGYFLQQAGSGLPVYKRAVGGQVGRGILGTIFRRFSTPIIKYLGRKAVEKGRTLGPQVIRALASRAERGVQRLADKAEEKLEKFGNEPQEGSGRKGRKYLKRHPYSLLENPNLKTIGKPSHQPNRKLKAILDKSANDIFG